MTLVLGSQSPRRREILSFFSLPFVQASPHFDEESVPFEGDPVKFAIAISSGKAISLQPLFPNDIILTADTVVYRDGKTYAKPANDAEALAMLKELAGRWHSVYTAMTVKTATEQHSICQETRVEFRDATEEQLKRYHQSIHCLDKAGSYAIQGAGGVIVHRIEGCYYNVMGLPLEGMATLLDMVGIDLWNYLK